MYDKNRLKKLLKYPLDNFNKLVKLYCKHIIELNRINFGKSDNEDLALIKVNLENIEDEFDVITQLEPYLELKDVLAERVKKYIDDAKAIPTFNTLYKTLISYREKNKWGTIVFSDEHSRVIVYLPSESVTLTFINPSKHAFASHVTQTHSNTFSNSPLSPTIFRGPNGPNSPLHGPSNPIPHDQILQYMFNNTNTKFQGYHSLSIRYSPYELYYGLLNYIENNLLRTNSHLFPMLRYMDARAITLNDLLSMNKAITVYYGNNMLDLTYSTRINLVNYAIKLHCLVVQALLHFNPHKNYRFPGVPISFALQDAIHYTERYAVTIGEQINGYRC